MGSCGRDMVLLAQMEAIMNLTRCEFELNLTYEARSYSVHNTALVTVRAAKHESVGKRLGSQDE